MIKPNCTAGKRDSNLALLVKLLLLLRHRIQFLVLVKNLGLLFSESDLLSAVCTLYLFRPCLQPQLALLSFQRQLGESALLLQTTTFTTARR